MAGNADLLVMQGDDYQGLVTVTKPDTAPLDVLTGYTARAQIRAGNADEYPVLVNILTNITSPYIALAIPHSDTVRLQNENSLRWDLQLTDTNGFVTTLLAGLVRLQRDVTV